jgi:hypothetical protein
VVTTPQQVFERAQGAAAPKEDLSPYEGSWVALRDGRVVASDPDVGRLRENPAVHDDDVLTVVPRDHQSILIA